MQSRRSRGLRQRLALILLPSLLFLLLASAAAQYLLAVLPLQDELDRSLADVALALAERLGVGESGNVSFTLSDEAAELLDADAVDDNWFAAFNDVFETIAGEPELRWPAVDIRRGEPFFFNTVVDGVPVRAVAVKASCGARSCGVIVARTENKRASLIRAVQLSALLPVALAGLISMVLVWFGLRSGLKPLVGLSIEVFRRSPRDLSPIRVEDAPAELGPLVVGVNRLMRQLGEASLAQQKFLATAAHQLRTPLAGLQSRIELAQLEAGDEEARSRLDGIHESAVRAARLAVQLLSLARAEPGASTADECVALDLAKLAAELVDEWVPRAYAKQIDLGFELEAAPAEGAPLLLRELIVNLLHNALEYTQEGGRVTVRTGVEAGSSFVSIEDNGPGIPAEFRQAVLGRFFRMPASPGAGSGLGLAIVREIVEAHHASMSLDDAPGGQGLIVRVCFSGSGLS